MDQITGDEDQLVGVRLHQDELEADPDLFYDVLDKCRTIFFKTDIEKLPGGGVLLKSALAWEHQKTVPKREPAS